MVKRILQRLAVLGLCTAMVSGTALAANTAYKNIQVQYPGIKLVVDGITVTPKDANGTTVEPFVYNGTTYLPVRAVGNAIGKQVTWDGNSKTVYLGEAPNSRKWLMSVCPPYEKSGRYEEGTFKMGGKTYTHGFELGENGCVMFNLNGQYSTLSCDIGHIDESTMHDGTFEIYLDGDLAQVIEMGAEDMVTHFDIPLHKALQLKIVMKDKENHLFWGIYGFANCELS